MEGMDDVHAANTLVLRVVDFLNKTDRTTLERNLNVISENLSKLAERVPKESFYGILRFIVDESQKDGEKSDLFDKILEKMVEKEELRKMVSEI